MTWINASLTTGLEIIPTGNDEIKTFFASHFETKFNGHLLSQIIIDWTSCHVFFFSIPCPITSTCDGTMLTFSALEK